MNYLYLDTTDHLIVGLLDSNLSWIEYLELDDRKSSGKIHGVIFELLEKYELSVESLSGVFQVSGPGSYTGMRVSEGIVRVFDWESIPTYSFYHFDVPKITGITEGKWLSSAFKGEVFVYSWSEEDSNKFLFKDSDLASFIHSSNPIYTHFDLDNIDLHNDKVIKYSSELIKNKSKEVFRHVLDRKMRVEPFYYRSLEIEFSSK